MGLRVAVGVLGFLLLAVFGATVLAAMGQPGPIGSIVALVSLFGAFASLHWGLKGILDRSADPLARARGHVRMGRFALGLATLVGLYFMSALPLPPSAAELPLYLEWGLVVGAVVAAAVLMRRKPGAAHALLVGTSLWAAAGFARATWRFGTGGERIGPALAASFFLIFLMVASIWYALWAFRRVRPILAAYPVP